MKLSNGIKVKVKRGPWKGQVGKMEMPRKFGGRSGMTIMVEFENGDKVSFAMGNLENLPENGHEEMISAAKLAGVLDFVNRHPKGFDMEVGERGELLSGGQRQAVALARTLLMKPPILLLDEPTASVDNNFEQELKKAMPEYLNDKTLILVTHRSSMLDLVDRVVVLEYGKIVADGPKNTIIEALNKANQ